MGEKATNDLLSGESTLGSSERFEEVDALLGSDLNPIFFVDIEAALNVAKAFQVDTAEDADEVTPILEHFTYAVIGVKTEGDTTLQTLRGGDRMTEELPTAFTPSEIEGRWYDFWEQSGYFHGDANTDKEPWSLVIPPPNVTGALHMGHCFRADAHGSVCRAGRSCRGGGSFLPGTDHAGIATQNVVERELAREGVDRQRLGRERVRRAGVGVEGGVRRTDPATRSADSAVSCDWERERFTMDEGLSRAVRTVFVRWFDDDLIYRGNRIINWCPCHTTALSDIEVEHEDVAGELVTFRYRWPTARAISRSRPLGSRRCWGTQASPFTPKTSVTDLVGKRVIHPFFPDRDMPIVADDAVDPEFGTGAVKVTPAHDPTDFEIGERHGLEKINILDEHRARQRERWARSQGLDRYEARAVVLEELTEARSRGQASKRPYVHSVGHCYRCNTEIEPWLSRAVVRQDEATGGAGDGGRA